MADLNVDLKSFVNLVIKRGLGLYGQEKMAKICYDSGIALTDKNEVEWLSDNHAENVKKLLENYGTQSLPAKMTAIVLARQHNIPVPESLLKKKKKKSRWLSRFRRKKN
ncbi:MAG: hypothetical protein ACTSVY_02260 [Candidatus Helarchaeota archaeon]